VVISQNARHRFNLCAAIGVIMESLANLCKDVLLCAEQDTLLYCYRVWLMSYGTMASIWTTCEQDLGIRLSLLFNCIRKMENLTWRKWGP
jgi:hypothetical protein